ncbi:uncharacterized protein LOC111057115 [Nilaparvata lugens]|uniref:uncharacterized protein LOC111057115 n=1 Tax=Nilaparvata lugens TaxID=108931 RepID=UPI00193E0BF4|nr:uncharacterized protein LOC111057115 [Nilaparvata lugens]
MHLRRLLRPPLLALVAVQISICSSAGAGENPVVEGKREKTAGGRHPEKRGTLRLTAIPGHNTFPYRYVYPLGQPAFAQYAAYNTAPRTPHTAALASPSAGLKLAGYPVPSTAMLLVMAHPHAGSPYAGTFMLIPAASAYNYNLLPQVAAAPAPVAAAPVPGRVAYAYAIPATPAAHYIKPGYANIVAAHQLLYKGPGLSSSSQVGGGTSTYSGEDETESAESSTVSTYGSRTRNAPNPQPQQHFKGR